MTKEGAALVAQILGLLLTGGIFYQAGEIRQRVDTIAAVASDHEIRIRQIEGKSHVRSSTP